MLQSIYEKLSQSYQKLSLLLKALKLTPTEPLAECSEIILNDVDCLSWQSKIQEKIEQNEHKLNEYEEYWMQLAHIWQSDKQTIITEFESIECASALRYDQKIQELIKLSNQVAMQEVLKKVNFTLVDAMKLRETILIEIEEWKQMYLISLKEKAQTEIIEFFTYTNENGQKLSVEPKSVEELQKCCAIYGRLRGDIDNIKCNLNSLSEQFEVLLKYGVPTDNELNEMKQKMPAQWEDYLKKLYDADEVLKNTKDSFKLTLESTRKTPDFFQ